MPLFVQEKNMGPSPKSVEEFLQRYPHFKVHIESVNVRGAYHNVLKYWDT